MSNIPPLLMLTADEIDGLLTLPELVQTQRDAFEGLARGTAALGPRVLLPTAEDGTVVFSYAARLSPESAPTCKFGAVVPGNASRQLPTVAAAVIALDPESGQPAAILNGEAVTRARTVAASVLAASALSPAVQRLAVIGLGAQGNAHLSAFIEAFQPASVRVWSSPPTTQLTADIGRRHGAHVAFATDAEAAVRGADTVVTCTSSAQPVLDARWLEPGATLLSIGSFAPDRCEVGPDVIAGARIVVDHRPTACDQAGPIVQGLADASIRAEDLAELGEVLLNRVTVRRRSEDLVYYNSVGVGIQDAAVTDALLARARERGVGHLVHL